MDFAHEIKFDKKCIVEMMDFYSALTEVKPDFGVDEDKIGQRTRGSFINYGPRFNDLWGNAVNAI
jgi:hypothetical protein